MFAKLGTYLQFTTPYRPQFNGVCERVNQKIKKLLRLWNVHDASWDEYIGPIQFLVNNEHNQVLNMSAFQAIHGWTLTRMDFLSPDHIDIRSRCYRLRSSKLDKRTFITNVEESRRTLC